MKLSERKLDQLKKLRETGRSTHVLEHLYEKYLCTQSAGIEISNIFLLLDENVCSFEELVDTFKTRVADGRGLECFLRNSELTTLLLESKHLTHDGACHLLNQISTILELGNLFRNNRVLTKFILSDFLINAQHDSNLSRILKKAQSKHTHNNQTTYIQSIFEYIEFFHSADSEICFLNEVSRCLLNFDLSTAQKIEIRKLLQLNDSLLTELQQISRNGLQSTFSFEELKQHLLKPEKPQRINI